jgi:hypothetical protein
MYTDISICCTGHTVGHWGVEEEVEPRKLGVPLGLTPAVSEKALLIALSLA